MTKWKRLFNAFITHQNQKQYGNHVVVFINRAMNPVQYTKRPGVFAFRRDELNTVLALCGMRIGEDGKIRWSAKVQHLDEALERASRLHAALVTRLVHQDVLSFCRAELLQENYFHAVFEAMKSIAAKTRSLSGLNSDGAQLVQEAFGFGQGGSPILGINSLVTETEKGEQRGFANLLTGLFGTHPEGRMGHERTGRSRHLDDRVLGPPQTRHGPATPVTAFLLVWPSAYIAAAVRTGTPTAP
jgi:uncharacterized protein (TIGR02391 family)